MGPALLPTPLSPMRGLGFRRSQELGIRWFSFRSVRRLSFQSITGARTGIRFHPPLYPVECARSENPRFCPRPTFNGRLRSLVFPCWPDPSSGCIAFRSEDLHSTPPSASDRDGPAHGRTTSLIRHRPTLRPAEAIYMEVSRPAWTGSSTSFRFGIFPVLSGFWAFKNGCLPSRSDDLKLRLANRFFKRARAELSTFPGFPCGGRWISQQLIEKFGKRMAAPAQYCAATTRSRATSGRVWPVDADAAHSA